MNCQRAFIGRRGCGKTTCMEHFSLEITPRRVIWDPNEQFWNGEIATAPHRLEQLIQESRFPVIYRPGDDLESDFEDFADEILSQTRLAVEIDEASRLMSSQWIHEQLDYMVRRARHLELAIHVTTHRMQDTNGLFLDECTDYVLFRAKGKRALDKIADYTSDEAAEIVASLEPRQFLHWNVERESFVVEKDSASWFEPISQPERTQHRGQSAAA